MQLLYDKIVKPIVFTLDPEEVHHFFNNVGWALGSNGLTRAIVRAVCRPVSDPVLETEIAGIKLKHPLGIGAGFDKEGRIVRVLSDVGFAFAEVGTVTGCAGPGNKRPRLWRLPEDNALIVNYGLVSSGAENAAKRFAKERAKWPVPVGISVAKSNLPDLSGEAGLEDLISAYQQMEPFADYITVNVSCPNVGDSCQYCDDAGLYRELLNRLHALNPTKPVFFKLSPELSEPRMLEILKDTEKFAWAKGFVLTNLTHSREGLNSPKLAHSMKGGASGPGLKPKADAVLAFMAKNGRPRFEFIGVGGICSVEDAYRKIKLGASAIQIVTSLIYNGPLWPSKLMRSLAERVKKDGHQNIREAIGKDL